LSTGARKSLEISQGDFSDGPYAASSLSSLCEMKNAQVKQSTYLAIYLHIVALLDGGIARTLCRLGNV
jgi:hypothetical protein